MKYQPHSTWQLDYVRVGRYFSQWKYPPKFVKAEVLEWFSGSEGLAMCDEKLGELLERQKQLKARFRNNVQYIKSVALAEEWDEFSAWVALYLESAKASELSYIKRWLYYYIKISDALNEKLGREMVFKEEKGRITDQDIDRAREYPITELYNGPLRHNYNRYIGLCPFHDEKTPSFTIFENNRYMCFGCQAHGSSIDFVMRSRNMSFIEAVKELLRFQ